ncbi:hypothetical protein ABI59_20770 [Acidobacteria bacterium Mor1]|nr:hypothetical protein ABI59_20770 [Acidobacteria bacterium Mor1]
MRLAFWLLITLTLTVGGAAAQDDPPEYSHTHETGGITSEQCGSQAEGCAAATFSNIANDMDIYIQVDGDECCKKMPKEDIIEHFKDVTTFDGGVEKLQELLGNACPCFKYTINIKRVKDYVSKPSTDDEPDTTTDGNVTTNVYRPHNFGPQCIADAMDDVGGSLGGGIGMGGVQYNNEDPPVDQAAHMVTPTGVNTEASDNGRHNVQFHDPYDGSSTDSEMATDADGRQYFLLWGKWFHAEELIWVTTECLDDDGDGGDGDGDGDGGGSGGGRGGSGSSAEECCCIEEDEVKEVQTLESRELIL